MVQQTVPLYQQMMTELIHQIEIGALKENDKLPSEQELGKKFNISRITVRKALDELQNRNFIYKKQGQGSFVLSSKIRNRDFHYWDIKAKIREMGDEAKSNIDRFSIIADRRYADIKHLMNLNDVDYLYEIKKTYLGNNHRIMFRHVFIAYDRFPEIKLDELQHEEIIPLISGKYNFSRGKFEIVNHAALVRKEDMAVLDADVGNPMVKIERRGYDGDRLVYFEQAQVIGFLPMYLGLDVPNQV